jgi:iron complex outermembrane receptor protein
MLLIFQYQIIHFFDAGAFLFAKWKNNNWTVSGGFRYDIRQLKGGDFYTSTNDSTGFKSQGFCS